MDKVELTERWHQACYYLKENISPSISEELFEQKVFLVLEKMGWSSYRNEIQPKLKIQVGSTNHITPDIEVISLEKNFKFVIEIKKPSAIIDNSSHKNQLFSYMRMRKYDYGLLIGREINIYYDGNLSNSESPILISEFPFAKSSEKGIKFIELFSKETYSESQLKIFTEQALARIKARKDYEKVVDLITGEEYIDKVKTLIKDDLQSMYSDQTIFEVLKNVNIKISEVPKLKSEEDMVVVHSFENRNISTQGRTLKYSYPQGMTREEKRKLRANSRRGIINSIINSISTRAKTMDEIHSEIINLFPERLPDGMMNTIKAQLSGNNPLRIEKEQKIKVKISTGDDNKRRYLLSEANDLYNKDHETIESHIRKSFGMNKDEFVKYLADKYVLDSQQKEIFLSKDVWLKVKLNYIGGLILKTEGKEIFAPKEIREVLRTKIIPSLSEISDSQLSGCLLTQDVCLEAADPKWHNGYPCLKKVGDGKYSFIGFQTDVN